MKIDFIEQIKDLYSNQKIAKLIRRLNIEKRTVFSEKLCAEKIKLIFLKNDINIHISNFLIKKLRSYDLGVFDKQNNINREDGKEKNKYDIANYNGFTPTEICNNLKIKSAPRFRSSVFYQNILYLVGRYDIIPYILQDLRKKRAKKEKKLLNNA